MVNVLKYDKYCYAFIWIKVSWSKYNKYPNSYIGGLAGRPPLLPERSFENTLILPFIFFIYLLNRHPSIYGHGILYGISKGTFAISHILYNDGIMIFFIFKSLQAFLNAPWTKLLVAPNCEVIHNNLANMIGKELWSLWFNRGREWINILFIQCRIYCLFTASKSKSDKPVLMYCHLNKHESKHGTNSDNWFQIKSIRHYHIGILMQISFKMSMNDEYNKFNTNHSPHKWGLFDQLKIIFFFKLTQWHFDPTVLNLFLNSQKIIERRLIRKWGLNWDIF